MENKIKQSLIKNMHTISDAVGLLIYNICYSDNDDIIDQITEAIVVIGKDNPDMLQHKNVLAIIYLFVIALMFDGVIDTDIDTGINISIDEIQRAQDLLSSYGFIIKK